MSATVALLLGGGVAAAIAVGVASKAKSKGGRGDPAAPPVNKALFETGPDGMVSFKPAVSAGFLATALSASGYDFPEAGNEDLIILTTAAGLGSDVARNWVIDENVAGRSILAVRHITVPTAPPPNGPMRLMMSVEPGEEADLTRGNSLWAVFALAGTLAPGAGAPIPGGDPRIPNVPLPTDVPDVPGFPNIPPGGVTDPDLPPIPPPVIPPLGGGGMPPGIKAEFDRVLNDPTATPEELRAVAAVLDSLGFPAEAEILRTKAAAIEAEQAIIEAAPRAIVIGLNGLPLPGNVAIHYTGQIARFKELATPVNPQIKVVPVPGKPGQFGLSPWAGQTVEIPSNWPAKSTLPAGALPAGSSPFDAPGGGGFDVPPGGDVDLGNPFGGIADSFGQFDDFLGLGEEDEDIA